MTGAIKNHVRNYPLSCLCILLIWVLSLTPFFPETPFDDVQFIDKWTHVVMYGGTCVVLWAEYFRQHVTIDIEKTLFWAVLMPAAMGGLLELLQAYCTTTRSGEWLDFWADSAGVLLAAVLSLTVRRLAKSL